MANEGNVSAVQTGGVSRIAHMLAVKRRILACRAALRDEGDLAESQAATTEPVMEDNDVNVLRVAVEPGWRLVKYRVDFRPKLASKFEKIHLFHGMASCSTLGPARVYDGEILYLPHRLPGGAITVTMADAVITVSLLRETGGEAEKVAFFNLLFQDMSRCFSCFQLQRMYFNPNSPIIALAEKLQVWPGQVTAIGEEDGRLQLSCNVSHRVLNTTTVFDELLEIQLSAGRFFYDVARHVLRGCHVMTRYTCAVYRVDDVIANRNPLSIFDCQGESMSYCNYYKRQYRIDIKDVGQPLLLVSKPGNAHGVRDAGLVLLVPELCVMTNCRGLYSTPSEAMASSKRAALADFVANVYGEQTTRDSLKEWGIVSIDSTV